MWLRTTTFGDDKDRVVLRSNGEPTYFAADVAYMLDKRERGFERQLDPVGADHHGYAPRLKAAMAALGGDPDTIEVADHPVRPPRRRRRAGRDVQAARRVRHARRAARRDRRRRDPLLHAPALARPDARSRPGAGSPAVGREPVYYVQYAHARIASMLARGSRRSAWPRQSLRAPNGGPGELHAAERDLIKKLVGVPR